MAGFYQYFFKLRIMHDYYTQGYARDFKLVPLPQTERLLSRHRLVFKEVENGFDIISLMTDATTPFIDLGDDEKLSFALVLENRSFFNFTDIDNKDNFSQAYHLDNKNLDALEMTEDGWSLVELKPRLFDYSKTSAATKIELAITDPYGEEIVDEAMDKNGSQFSYLVDAGNRPEGKYTLTPEIDDVAQTPELFYLAEDLTRLRPFAVVDFFSDELDYANAKTYTIQFEVRKSQWKYKINLGKDYTGSTISVNDTRDTPEITFKNTGGVDFSEGNVLTFASFKASNDSEAAEIAFDQTPITDFDLVIQKNGDKTELKALPNPSIHHTKTEMHINI